MISGFYHCGGPLVLDKLGTTASTALAMGDALITTTGLLALQTASTKNTGVALGTKAVGDAATTAISYIRPVAGRTRFLCSPKNSSNLVATDVHGQFDYFGITGAGGFDRAVTTNGGVFLWRVRATGTTTGLAEGIFTDPDSESST